MRLWWFGWLWKWWCVDISVLFPGVVLYHYHVLLAFLCTLLWWTHTDNHNQSSSLKGNFDGIPSLDFPLGMLKELSIEVPLRNISSVSKCILFWRWFLRIPSVRCLCSIYFKREKVKGAGRGREETDRVDIYFFKVLTAFSFLLLQESDNGFEDACGASWPVDTELSGIFPPSKVLQKSRAQPLAFYIFQSFRFKPTPQNSLSSRECKCVKTFL